MKNVFADVSTLAARTVSPLNIAYDAVAADTKPRVSAFLKTLDNSLGFKASEFNAS